MPRAQPAGLEATSGWGIVSICRPPRRAGRSIQVAFGLGLCCVVVVAVLTPRNSWFVFDRPVVLITAAVTLAVLLVARRGGSFPAAHWSQSYPRGAVAAGTAVGMVLSGIYAASATISFGWDAGAVTQAAVMVHTGDTLSAHLLDYFARFPNNVPLLFLEVTAIRAGALLGLSAVTTLVLLQVLLVGLLLAFLGSTVLLLGHPRRILPVQAVGVVLIGLSPQVAVPYTDIPGAACVAVAVTTMTCASLAASPGRRMMWAAATTVALTVGMILKPYIAVALIAVALMLLIVMMTARSWRLARKVVLALGLGAVLVTATLTGINLASQHATGLTSERLQDVRHPFPVELWLASGTYDSQESSPVRRYGAYNQQLIEATAALSEPQRQQDMLRERVRDQITSRSVRDNLAFFSQKVAWVWGDGTFWASGEGSDSRQEPIHNKALLNELSTWTVASGEHYGTKASITQGIWLALLAITGMRLLVMPYHWLVTTCSLTLIGLTGYLTLFEARPRYLVALLPVLLAITAATQDHTTPPGDRLSRPT